MPEMLREPNSSEHRRHSLQQEELSKIGESDVQNLIKAVPFLGPLLKYSYDQISSREALGKAAIDALMFIPLGGTAGKAVPVAKNANKTVAREFDTNNFLKTIAKWCEEAPNGMLNTKGGGFFRLLGDTAEETEGGFFGLLKNPNGGFLRLGGATEEEIAQVTAKETTVSVSAKGSTQFVELDWSTYRTSHINEHMSPSISKLEHGVFYGNPIDVTNEAWTIVQEQKIQPILIRGRDHYIVPRANSGYYSGYAGNEENLNRLLLITDMEQTKWSLHFRRIKLVVISKRL